MIETWHRQGTGDQEDRDTDDDTNELILTLNALLVEQSEGN